MQGKNIVHVLLAVVFFFSITEKGRAEENEAKKVSPFKVNLKIDIPVMGISTLVATSVLFLDDNLPKGHDSDLSRGKVNVMDRSVIGNSSEEWDIFGTVGTILVPAAAVCMSFIELPDYGWDGVIEDIIIIGESISVASMVNQLVAGAMPRARPYMYDPLTRQKQARNSSWDWRSFYSGHAGACFAATTAFSYLFTVRHPHHKLIPAVWAVSLASSSMVAVSRPLAGEHFWSDTIIGSVIGLAWGILIPALHQKSLLTKAGDVRLSFSGDTIGMRYYF